MAHAVGAGMHALGWPVVDVEVSPNLGVLSSLLEME